MMLLYLEDDPFDVELLRDYCAERAPDCELVWADSRNAFLTALDDCRAVISDSGVHDLTGIEALTITRTRQPGIPFVFLCGTMAKSSRSELLWEGPDGVFCKDHPEEVAAAIRIARGIER